MKRYRYPIAALALAVAFALLAVPLSRPAEAATVLEIGSRGSNVTKVQTRLIKWGFMSGPADGVYGQATYQGVRRFQAKYGLTVDGKVGPTTAAKMGITLSASGGGTKTASASTSSDLNLLARLVYAEARGESYKGQVAVAAVVLNRVRSSKFPNTIAGVIYQAGQFSPVSNGSINRAPNATAIRAAREAMNGWDPTGGCLFFYNAAATNEPWIRTRTIKTVIGNHAFAV
ncbi:MAG: spore cortex-lytic enzyme [Clostridiales bacterium]|nr:spore cortex-lytic enzyme [Clostridiales bacterium]